MRPRKDIVLATALALVTVIAAVESGGAQARSMQSPSPALRGGSPERQRLFVPGEVVVAYEPGVSRAERARLRARFGMEREEPIDLPRVDLLTVPEGSSVNDSIAQLERNPDIRYAEPNYIYEASDTIPDDRFFDRLWGLHNTGQTVAGVAGSADADIDAPEAWDRERGDDEVVVAVADTGVAFDHPDLANSSWKNPGEVAENGADDDNNGFVDDVTGYDFIDGDNDPADFDSHGTHVAGTIGARGNDGNGITGVSWDATLMAVRVLDALGGGTNAGIAQGFDYAGDEGADIVNASLGGGSSSRLMMDTINAHPDTLFVVAAGNGGGDGVGDDNETTPHYPCNYTSANVICVAATDSKDELSGFSNYGTTSVDLGAPGDDILSTLPSWATLHHYSFEAADDQGWTTGGTSSWVVTEEAASDGGYSFTDSPGQPYAPNADTWVKSPQLDLAGRKGCNIVYDMRLDTERRHDSLRIETSAENTDGSWTQVDQWNGATTEGKFFEFLSPIDTLDGENDAWVRFRLDADQDVEGDGAHLDNIRVRCLDDSFTDQDYAYFSGTSMATPHVAGAAALLLSAEPRAGIGQLRDALLDTGDRLSALSERTVTGRRLNLQRALFALAPPLPTLSIEDSSILERDGGSAAMTFDVILSEASDDTIRVDYDTNDLTAEQTSDYQARSGTLTFEPGQTRKTISVPVVGDHDVEGDEALAISLSAPTSAAIDDGEARGIIHDDDDESPDPPDMTKPKQRFQKRSSVRVEWTDTSSEGGGEQADTYDVRMRRAAYNRKGFQPATILESRATATDMRFRGSPGSTYCFSVRSVRGTAASSFSGEKCTAIPLDDRLMTRSREWKNKNARGYFLNTFRSTNARGAILTRTDINTKEIALLVKKCPKCGALEVFWKGDAIRRVGLKAQKTKRKVLVPIETFGRVRSGVLKVKTSSTDKAVVVDGIGVLH